MGIDEDTGTIDSLADEVTAGSRRALSRAITLVESTRPDHRQQANALLSRLMPHTGGAIRIGLTGVPGAGKSVFIESMGNHLLDQGRRLAVLAVDPSSVVSGGSILGDKTRMETLSRRSEVFIRPSPAGATLGGVARRTREALLLCEAAGFDAAIVETVGVGQTETAVADMTDLFLLLLLPGSGDELQGIKRGIMELADLVVVNKADGDRMGAARQTASHYLHALKMVHPRTPDWTVPVKCCSALEGEGISEVWKIILDYFAIQQESGELARRRGQQAKSWMWSEMTESLIALLRNDRDLKNKIPELEQKVVKGEVPVAVASEQLLEFFLRRT